jgi:hypothetical protein
MRRAYDLVDAVLALVLTAPPGVAQQQQRLDVRQPDLRVGLALLCRWEELEQFRDFLLVLETWSTDR